MKACFIAQHGGSDVLNIGDFPDPKPKENEVLVRLEYAALNHVDIWVRKGIPAYPVEFPHILGSDGAGFVEEIGSEVEGLSKGDAVTLNPAISCGECSCCKKGFTQQCLAFEILGTKRKGTYAEYVCVPDQNVILLPEGFLLELAAAYPLTHLTAYHMLVGRASMKPKEKLLVVGASSGIGTAAVQIGKILGAKVFAITTHKNKVEKLKSLGADHVFSLDAGKDFSVWIRQITQGQGVDVVLDHVGPATWNQSLQSLGPLGRLVNCGATSGPSSALDHRLLFSKEISILGARMGTVKEFRDVSELVFKGKIIPLIDQIFQLSEAQKAHDYLESQKHVGKVLLKIRS